jgi:hypothetical protein
VLIGECGVEVYGQEVDEFSGYEREHTGRSRTTGRKYIRAIPGHFRYISASETRKVEHKK